MAAKNSRFISQTVEDFTSHLPRRNPADEETNVPIPRTGWFGFGRRNQLPKMVRRISVSDEEKVHVGKVKKLGTFSGVCDKGAFWSVEIFYL
jgi:hypothetical protein